MCVGLKPARIGVGAAPVSSHGGVYIHPRASQDARKHTI